MAESTWSGFLRLSLVSCRVHLSPATTEGDGIRLQALNRATGNPVEARLVDSRTGDVVSPEAAAQAYRSADGQYVQLSEEELSEAAGPASQIIDIDEFIPLGAIDRLFFEEFYYVYPDEPLATDTVYTIRTAMLRKGQAGVGHMHLGGRERRVLVEPRGAGLLLTILRSADRVAAAAFEEREESDVPIEMIEIAESIIARRATKADPGSFRDRRDEGLRRLIEARGGAAAAAPSETTAAPPSEPAAAAGDAGAIGATEEHGSGAETAPAAYSAASPIAAEAGSGAWRSEGGSAAAAAGLGIGGAAAATAGWALGSGAAEAPEPEPQAEPEPEPQAELEPEPQAEPEPEPEPLHAAADGEAADYAAAPAYESAFARWSAAAAPAEASPPVEEPEPAAHEEATPEAAAEEHQGHAAVAEPETPPQRLWADEEPAPASRPRAEPRLSLVESTLPAEEEQQIAEAPAGAAAEAAEEAAENELGSEIFLHIIGLGERRYVGSGWAGTPGSRQPIEALSIRPREGLARNAIEFRVFARDGRATSWVTDGNYAGSWGRRLPLTGFAIRPTEEHGDDVEIVYEGYFAEGGVVGPKRDGELCVSPIADDPLEAVLVRILERAA